MARHPEPGAVRRAADPWLRGQVGQIERPAAAGQPVPCRQHGAILVGEEAGPLEVARRDLRQRLVLDRSGRDRSRRPRVAGAGAGGDRPPRSTSPRGCRRRKCANAGGASVASAVGKLPNRRRPRRRPAISPSSCSAPSRRARIAVVCRVSACPASVSATGREPRSTTGVPTSRSSAAMCWLTADCVRDNASAAAEKEPRAAISDNTRNLRTSSISATYRPACIVIASNGDAGEAWSHRDPKECPWRSPTTHRWTPQSSSSSSCAPSTRSVAP